MLLLLLLLVHTRLPALDVLTLLARGTEATTDGRAAVVADDDGGPAETMEGRDRCELLELFMESCVEVLLLLLLPLLLCASLATPRPPLPAPLTAVLTQTRFFPATGPGTSGTAAGVTLAAALAGRGEELGAGCRCSEVGFVHVMLLPRPPPERPPRPRAE